MDDHSAQRVLPRIDSESIASEMSARKGSVNSREARKRAMTNADVRGRKWCETWLTWADANCVAMQRRVVWCKRRLALQNVSLLQHIKNPWKLSSVGVLPSGRAGLVTTANPDNQN
jgi:hypothetical protein